MPIDSILSILFFINFISVCMYHSKKNSVFLLKIVDLFGIKFIFIFGIRDPIGIQIRFMDPFRIDRIQNTGTNIRFFGDKKISPVSKLNPVSLEGILKFEQM